MLKIDKVGVISACWQHAAYSHDTGKLIGYFDCDDKTIVDNNDKLLYQENEFEVVLLNETAWD